MAVNRSRSQNAELEEGMGDGAFKKIPVNRSVVSDPNLDLRREMPWQYGFAEAPLKYRPDTGAIARSNPSDHG